MEASAAEVEAVRTVWQAAQAASSPPPDERPVAQISPPPSTPGGSDIDFDVHLHSRAVCSLHFMCSMCVSLPVLNFWLAQVVVAREAVGNLGGMVRQLSLDQFENESRRMMPMSSDALHSSKKFMRQKSPQGLHKKVGSTESFFCTHTQRLTTTHAGL